MNSRVKQLILKILLIKEEFSEKDIREAVVVLRDCGTISAFIDYLAQEQNEDPTSRRAKPKLKPLHHQQSKLVMKFADKDEEKYRILSEFDNLLRKGKILHRVEDIRQLGNSISKDYPKVKSRKEAVLKLVNLLSEKTTEQVREILQDCLSELSQSQDTSEYHELAQFIISGLSNQNNR